MEAPRYLPIEDYAIIGNLRSAALVSKYGSIDWAPAPFIHSPSVFAAILDARKGGFWRIEPVRSSRTTQQYIPETNIVRTTFENDVFACEVLDFMPIDNEAHLTTAHEDTSMRIKRKVVCLRGECRLRFVFVPHSNCWLYRYRAPDGLNGDEGVFLLASFWLADAHYHSGEYDRAHEIMESVLRHANHVGLFAEELDPVTGRFLGNFPQAYTHIGLINSAFLLSRGD